MDVIIFSIGIPPPARGQYKVHGWAAVGYGFEMEKIHWYEVPGNSNGAISMNVYLEILKTHVLRWKERGDDFILEQDGAPGHGGASKESSRANNRIVRFLRQHDIEFFFICHDSPDLAPIENTWKGPKQYVTKQPHWDKESLKQLAQEGWDQVSQEFINRQIDSMPQRLRDCIALGGRMTRAGRHPKREILYSFICASYLQA